uniref:Uncharacterized protein n=1 Tax=Rhizophora mucronata TaxID=61149 RepID=A0A2P2Q1K6_RHIMU
MTISANFESIFLFSWKDAMRRLYHALLFSLLP